MRVDLLFEDRRFVYRSSDCTYMTINNIMIGRGHFSLI